MRFLGFVVTVLTPWKPRQNELMRGSRWGLQSRFWRDMRFKCWFIGCNAEIQKLHHLDGQVQVSCWMDWIGLYILTKASRVGPTQPVGTLARWTYSQRWRGDGLGLKFYWGFVFGTVYPIFVFPPENNQQTPLAVGLRCIVTRHNSSPFDLTGLRHRWAWCRRSADHLLSCKMTQNVSNTLTYLSVNAYIT